MRKLVVTVGDPAGVGPEIILAWARENLCEAANVEIVCHEFFAELLPEAFSVKVLKSADNFKAGVPTTDGATLALDALDFAAQCCKGGDYSGVVTAPVSKAQMSEVSPNFVGQTEFFENAWGGKAVMCFAGLRMILSLATWHIPLKEVSNSLNDENISRAVLAADVLAKKIRKIDAPRLALCGLNPHAGEDGLLGDEEIRLINPLAGKLQKNFPNLSRALPPDTVFTRLLNGEFDAAVAMYHDQGLAPLKALEFDSAVNVSMLLPYVRTSPDHGTAFNIAGKGIASHKSFAHAVEVAKLLSAE